MDFADVQNQVNDLPSTFKRQGQPYTQWVDSMSGGLTIFVQAIVGLLAQLSFANAQYGWVDVWGDLLTVARRLNEADSVYKTRIQNTILANRTTPTAMILWLALVEGVQATITELLPDLGYVVNLPPTLTQAQIADILASLAYVRPAGVPFNTMVKVGGTFLGTVNYLGAPRVTGAYLGGNAGSSSISIPSSTNNTLALLPDLLFTDPSINPSLV